MTRSGKPSSINVAREAGYRAGHIGRQRCLANYESSEEVLAWYEGWKQGRDDKQRDLVERMHIDPEFAPHFWSRGYAA